MTLYNGKKKRMILEEIKNGRSICMVLADD